MRDPDEGVATDGTIRTGVDRSRVPPAYEPVVAALVAAFQQARSAAPAGPAALLLYGSVATGRARPPRSDVDAFALGVPAAALAGAAERLSQRFASLCREVALDTAQLSSYDRDDDEAHGDRAFLKHCCTVLAGDDVAAPWAPFAADARAARGFNGDVGRHLQRWRDTTDGLERHPELAPDLGRRVARKTLVSAAGLVSVHDGTWTTDRASGARRWAEVDPPAADGLHRLAAWSEGEQAASVTDLHRALAVDGAVQRVVDAFASRIGLWPETRR